MSFSPLLGTTLSNTHLRTPLHVSTFSGMCSVCSFDCHGTCEIGKSAVRGSEAIYPHAADVNQFASEKKYPLDYSHFNINGRVFGAFGIQEDSDLAAFPNVRIETQFGKKHPIMLKAPIILPAMAKLNWQDYFSGAALSGVLAVIGEDVVAKDKDLMIENGKVTASPLLTQMVNAYRKYQKGFGDIVVQANEDDERLGVLEFAIQNLGVTTVELKFGQAAKGIQGMGRVKSIEEATRLKKMGYLVFPDPLDETVIRNYQSGIGRTFEKVGRLPMWTESYLKERIRQLRDLGAQRICFKTGPYDRKDLKLILKIASEEHVDLVTFDGAGGGTGNSPLRMMSEWGIPTVQLEAMVYELLLDMVNQGKELPQVAITGGLSMEDHVFKALAFGAPYIQFVGLGRAAMAAAMTAHQIGEKIASGQIPPTLKQYGETIQDVFENYKTLKLEYGEAANQISPGAVGVYSYLERVAEGLKQLMALNRKFTLGVISDKDLIGLTQAAEALLEKRQT